MKQKTAMQELVDYMKANFHLTDESLEKFDELLEKEKEQIMEVAIKCHFEGVRQSAKTSEEYISYGEQYYNETYKQD